jgi:hypothetical protein
LVRKLHDRKERSIHREIRAVIIVVADGRIRLAPRVWRKIRQRVKVICRYPTSQISSARCFTNCFHTSRVRRS